jgi:hypothetical protein
VSENVPSSGASSTAWRLEMANGRCGRPGSACSAETIEDLREPNNLSKGPLFPWRNACHVVLILRLKRLFGCAARCLPQCRGDDRPRQENDDAERRDTPG